MKRVVRLALLLVAAAVFAGCELEKDPSATPPPAPTPPPDITSTGPSNPTPDRLVYSSGRDEPDLEVYTSFPDGSGRTRLTRNAEGDSGPVAYPNAGLVYYVCGRSESICVAATSGTGTAGVLSSQRLGFPIIEDPAISPDGSRMILTAVRISPDGQSTNYDIYIYDFATEEFVDFAVGAALDQMPSWASDDTVVWSRFRNGDWDLVTFRIGSPRGSNPTPLTNNDVDDLGVDVSADGTKLAWIGTQRNDPNSGELFTMPFAGAGARRQTATPTSLEPVRLERGFIGGDPDTAWSPDGTRIAFAGYAPGEDDVEIFTIPATDGPVTNATNNDVYDVDPEWATLPPSVSVASPLLYTEGRPGGVVFEIFLDAPQTQEVSVSYTTVPGTATAADFTPQSGTAVFQPGQRRVAITVPVTNDTQIEPAETFSLRLTDASGGTLIANDEATGRIMDDEVEPTPAPPATPTPSASPTATPTAGPVTDGRIAFASDRSGVSQIYTMQADGGDVRHVSADQSSSALGSPNWSPDATRLIHTAMNSSGGAPQPEIVDRPSDGSGSFRMLQLDPSNDSDPVYVPGDAAGGYVFASDRDGDFELYYATPSGSSPVKLTDNSANDGHPSLARAEGVTRIVWHSDADGDFDVYTSLLSTGGTLAGSPTNLTQETAGQTPHSELAPDLSSDGARVTYHGNEHQDFDIYSLVVSSRQETHLTTDVANETNPAFSPTGSSIVFQKDLGGGNFDIFVMPSSGGAGTNVTNSPGADVTPEWGTGSAAATSGAASPAALAVVLGAPILLGATLARRRRRP
ncbi:MAG TPA: Calx-beta domain-containing protein [Actinomycetota bacterium]|nr:Calx-beta domain-containing protein [Actinomycetota bacterium]